MVPLRSAQIGSRWSPTSGTRGTLCCILKTTHMTIIDEILKERPVGTDSNEKVCDFLLSKAIQAGYKTITLQFDCKRWTKDFSYIDLDGNQYELFPSPFSQPFEKTGDLEIVSTLEELQNKNITDKIVLLNGDLTQQPLQPKNFPFYYPDEHKTIIDLLEDKQPKAIIAITGKHPMCGLNPFPLFEDGNFLIPSAFANKTTGEKITGRKGLTKLKIASKTENSVGRQIIASKKSNGKGKIVVCAHMDSKYGTIGAIDNAAGIEVLFQILDNLKDYNGAYDIDFVPFNGEEYYGVIGQLEYLKHNGNEKSEIKLVINIDSPGHVASKTALSTYNFIDCKQTWLDTKISKNDYIEEGSQWYAGDHAMFAFQGVPCIAVTSSNLFETVLDLTHTSNDTIGNVDFDILKKTSDFLTELIKDYND